MRIAKLNPYRFEGHADTIYQYVEYAVEWEDIGEGMHGEYNPDDPEDVSLYRFYVQVKDHDNEWQDVEDGSYCTLVPTSTEPEKLQQLLLILAANFEDRIAEGRSVKKLGERMSWIHPSWLDEKEGART